MDEWSCERKFSEAVPLENSTPVSDVSDPEHQQVHVKVGINGVFIH